VAARFSSLTAELGQAKATASQDLEFLTRIAHIYIELGGIKKGLLSLRRAKNQTADPGGKAALVERLAKLSREPEA
jgi:hypothetical protein